MSPIPVSESARVLWLRALSHYERALIFGPAGWFGRTALELSADSGCRLHLVGSFSRQISVNGRVHQVHEWDEAAIRRFAPDLVLDFAYLTRNWVATLGPEEYERRNKVLTARLMKSVSLGSVDSVLSISSGATLKNSLDLYGRGKLELEHKLRECRSLKEFNLAILRTWSVTGGFVQAPELYAFSSMISDALKNGVIKVESESLVFRRYCAVEELLAVGLHLLSGNQDTLIDSGGERIEMLDLAMRVSHKIPGTKVVVSHPQRVEQLSASYESNNLSWAKCSDLHGLDALEIDSQIENVIESFRNGEGR